MIADIAGVLLRANVALGWAILAILILRHPARRLFGAEVAYALWIVVPLAALASLAPPRSLWNSPGLAGLQTLTDADVALVDYIPARDHSAAMLGLWAAGVAVGLALLGLSQMRFLRRARAGEAGPALVGVLNPRIVTPFDYELRFTAEERDLIRLHEREHMTRFDARVNAAVALARCINWFNPLVHWAALSIRLDQELACDAAVLRRAPGIRRRYAETLIKAQMAADLPLGCHWPAPALHPLEQRLRLIVAQAPTAAMRSAGAGLVVALSAGALFLGWPADPARADRGAPPAPLGPVVLLRGAARVVVIPEDRPALAATIAPGRSGLPPLRQRRVGQVLVIEDGLGPHGWRAGRPGGAACAHAGDGSSVRIGGRIVAVADLPLVTVRAPLDARVSAEGAVFGAVGPSRTLSLFTRGCGDWTLAKARAGLAIAADGDGSVQAEGLEFGPLKVQRAGSGEVAVRGGAASSADIRSAGTGQVIYGGVAAELDAMLSGEGRIRMREVFGRASCTVSGPGGVTYRRSSGERFCTG